MGETHELFVLALSLVWFAGATPDCVSSPSEVTARLLSKSCPYSERERPCTNDGRTERYKPKCILQTEEHGLETREARKKTTINKTRKL